MQGMGYPKQFLKICATVGSLFLFSIAAQAQAVRSAASSDSSSLSTEAPAELRALSDLIRNLQDRCKRSARSWATCGQNKSARARKHASFGGSWIWSGLKVLLPRAGL